MSETGSQAELAQSGRLALWLPLGLFLGFVALVLVGLFWPASKSVESKFVGQPLPEFALAAASDDRPGLSRSDFVGGKPRLLNVFASWCVPCAIEAPQLGALKSAGVEIHGVAVRDHKPELAGFLARNGNPFARIGADNLSVVQLGIGSAGVPETFVIDAKGVIRHQHIGVITADDVPKLLAKLKEAEQ
ncbi:MAG: redoxin family protein [Novosphingobium sp.]|jgi:cytochrome c biogenesis protein CcmG/thiol:disulfide interchange protein DsbE